MAIEYPIYFIRADGHVVVANTPDDCRGWSVAAKHRHPHGVHFSNGEFEIRIAENEWIARDALGAVVLTSDLPRDERHYAWWARSDERARRAAELGLPIPGTGTSTTCYRRRPRIRLSEDRAQRCLAYDLVEAGLYPTDVRRGKRVANDPWDDGCRRRPQRCWKEQRRTRWK